MARPAKEPLRRNEPSEECSECQEPRPVGTLPWEWNVHCIDDAAYIKGYRMLLTCSPWCRRGKYGEER